MIDLESIAEAIKLQFTEPMHMKFTESYFFDNKHDEFFYTLMNYQIIGAYTNKNRVIAVVDIKNFQSTSLVAEFAMKSAEKKIIQEIVKRVPEAKSHVDIFAINNECKYNFT